MVGAGFEGRTMDERELYGLKWFDYKPLSPDMATLLMGQEHCRQSVYFYELLGEQSHFVKTAALLYSKLDLDNIRSWKRFDTMEKLRQWADQNGMRYDNFWRWAFEAILNTRHGTVGRKNDRGRSRFFVLNHFLNKHVLEDTLRRRDEAQATFITFSDHPYFQAAAYRGEPLQDSYHLYLLQELKRRFPAAMLEKLNILIENGRFSKKYLLRKAF